MLRRRQGHPRAEFGECVQGLQHDTRGELTVAVAAAEGGGVPSLTLTERTSFFF